MNGGGGDAPAYTLRRSYIRVDVDGSGDFYETLGTAHVGSLHGKTHTGV